MIDFSALPSDRVTSFSLSEHNHGISGSCGYISLEMHIIINYPQVSDIPCINTMCTVGSNRVVVFRRQCFMYLMICCEKQYEVSTSKTLCNISKPILRWTKKNKTQ